MRPDQKFAPLANCHAKGLFSIPLEQTENRVRRMFIDTLGRCHTIAPHSHRYELQLAFRKQTTHMQWVGRRLEWEEDNPPGNVFENPREDEPFAGPFPWSVW